MRRATPPATMRPRADPETPFMEAAPVAKAIGLPVAVGAVTTPVEATAPDPDPEPDPDPDPEDEPEPDPEDEPELDPEDEPELDPEDEPELDPDPVTEVPVGIEATPGIMVLGTPTVEVGSQA